MKIMSVDVGTTNLKLAIVEADREGVKISGSMVEKIEPVIPETGAYEHDHRYLRQLLFKSIIHRHGDVEAIVFTGYLFRLMALDKRGNEFVNIMTWMDE